MDTNIHANIWDSSSQPYLTQFLDKVLNNLHFPGIYQEKQAKTKQNIIPSVLI